MNCMYDYSKLLGLMREKQITQNELASRLGISETSLNKKLKGNSQFKQDEIRKILDCFDLSIEEVSSYFFCRQTCEITSITA